MLDAVFANTLYTATELNEDDTGLIGVFHGEMDLTAVRTKLVNAAY